MTTYFYTGNVDNFTAETLTNTEMDVENLSYSKGSIAGISFGLSHGVDSYSKHLIGVSVGGNIGLQQY